MYTVGFKGTGCDVELEEIRSTDKAYLVRDDEGNELWLPKSAFEEWGELNKFGMRLYQENV